MSRWNRSDLLRRVTGVLDFARQHVETLTAEGDDSGRDSSKLLRQKIVAETAMLLICVEHLRIEDPRIAELFEQIAKLLIPHARHEEVLGALCIDPGLAWDHAVSHVLLSRVGYPDSNVDRLVSQALALGADFGPERLPHRCLEQAWLARMRNMGTAGRSQSTLVAYSMLGRPLDALGASRLDVYAFTHAVMYASDFGTRQLASRRSRTDIAADAEVALACSLDLHDYDLMAEVLLSWPMLSLPWSPAATFAFQLLAAVEDRTGILPGPGLDLTRYATLHGEERLRLAFAASYHTVYVMGFLCSAALRASRAPPAQVVAANKPSGHGAAFFSMLDEQDCKPLWMTRFVELSADQQDSLSGVLLGVLMRQARRAADMDRVRAALEVALAADLIDEPATLQAAQLLQRCKTLTTVCTAGAYSASRISPSRSMMYSP